MKLTNGQWYIKINKNGGIEKVKDAAQAHEFSSEKEVNAIKKKARGKTKGYHVAFPFFENEELSVSKPKKIRRKQYSSDVRRLIYNHADGKCALCGDNIPFEKMTLDHIVPLAMGGADEVENLQCSCEACNQFKGSILPEDFFDKNRKIFLHHIQKDHPIIWRICKRYI